MALEINNMPRVFKMGVTILDDPDPASAPIDALKLYIAAYPQLASATLSDPVEEGGRLVFDVIKPPARTKG